MVTSVCSSRKRGTSGATWRRPKPAGAVMRKCPLAFTPPAETLASALARSDSKRWQSSKNALPSWVSAMRRVVRTSSLTPRRASSASRRRPMMAGATPSALAAAVRPPRVATETKDSSCLSLSMRTDYRLISPKSRNGSLLCLIKRRHSGAGQRPRHRTGLASARSPPIICASAILANRRNFDAGTGHDLRECLARYAKPRLDRLRCRVRHGPTA